MNSPLIANGAALAARVFAITEALYARCNLRIGVGPDKRVTPARSPRVASA